MITLELELDLAKDYYQEIADTLEEIRDLIKDGDISELIQRYEEIKMQEWFEEVFVDSSFDKLISMKIIAEDLTNNKENK